MKMPEFSAHEVSTIDTMANRDQRVSRFGPSNFPTAAELGKAFVSAADTIAGRIEALEKAADTKLLIESLNVYLHSYRRLATELDPEYSGMKFPGVDPYASALEHVLSIATKYSADDLARVGDENKTQGIVAVRLLLQNLPERTRQGLIELAKSDDEKPTYVDPTPVTGVILPDLPRQTRHRLILIPGSAS